MGLPCEEFHFTTAAPGFDAIYQAVCEIEGTDVPVIVHHFPSSPLSPNSSPDAASHGFVADSLYLYAAKTDLHIRVSLDRQNIFVGGNATGLLRSSCLALEKLGGTIVKPTASARRRTTLREWLWFLLMLPFGLLAMLFIGLPFLVVWFVSIPVGIGRHRWQEKKCRRRLVSGGRYMPASQLDAKLNSGEGTLIIEHLSPWGVIREWWTADDLIGDSPVPLSTSPILLPDGNQSTSLRAYAISCATRYTDATTGAAKLTETVPELSASRRKLSEKYPRAKIAVLFVFEWDAERSLIF